MVRKIGTLLARPPSNMPAKLKHNRLTFHAIRSSYITVPIVHANNFHQQEIFFIEISCPADINVSTKEDEKINKYCFLAADFHQMYNMPVTIIPGCMGVVSSHCLQFLKKIPGFTLKLFGHLQKAVLIGTSQVLRTIPIHQ